MQNYYLHHHCLNGLAPKLMRPYRTGEGPFVVAANHNSIELYRLLQHDLTFHGKHSFQAEIERIEVLPSLFHKHDYLWILDSKGRFCCWHPTRTDLVSNTVLWEQSDDPEEGLPVFSGANWQFQERNTVGVIFYSRGHILVLLHFTINETGIFIDNSNIIKYPLPSFNVRFAQWMQHSQSLFLLGMVVQEGSKTALCVFDLEKGVGVCEDSLEWRFQKANLLHFESAVQGELLIVTFNEVSLHNYKSSSALKNYRTKGNYGHGFHLGEGFYGHLGYELIVFSRDHLRTYGQVKANNAAVSFATLCFTHCSPLGFIRDGSVFALQTYQGEVYLMSLFQKTYTINRMFSTIGPILELCSFKSGNLFAVVSQQSDHFQVSLLQSQYQVSVKEQVRLQQQEAEKMMMVNGGIYIILCSQTGNNVYRLNRHQQYEFYFQLPEGNILAAEGNFIAYDQAIFQIDYQCSLLTLIVQTNILLAEAVKTAIYYLDEEGKLSVLQDQKDAPCVLLTNRQNDYYWGLFKKYHTLMTANLMQPKHLKLLSRDEVRDLSIKGHTLVTSISSITTKKSRYDRDERILVGYADGQIHMHSLIHGQLLHFTYAFDHYGSAPVAFCRCGEDAVLANYANKQYLISAEQGHFRFINLALSHVNSYIHLCGYIQKSQELCIARNCGSEGILLQRLSVAAMKDGLLLQNGQTFSIKKLQEWRESVPLLYGLQDRLVVAGCRYVHLIKLQNYKTIRTFHHGLREVVSIDQIKMGLILCGVDFHSLEHILILNEELQLICQFQLHTKAPVRCLRPTDDNNHFYLAYDDSLTLYRVTPNSQLQAVMGRKIQLSAYHLDHIEGQLLVNDPFGCLSLLEQKESINDLATFMPPYRIDHCLFMGTDIFTIDQRGVATAHTGRMDSIIDNYYKFTRIFAVSLGSPVSAVHQEGDAVYYATREGKVGVFRHISRDEFDRLKKEETEALADIEMNPNFSYWQWRDRPPAHQRIIDGEMFPQSEVLRGFIQ